MDDLGHVNRDLADEFQVIADIYEKDGDTYRQKVYSQAAERIRIYPSTITSGIEARRNIKGIGESISKDIDEFIETGHTTRLQQLEASHVDRGHVVELFESIFRVGPVLANRFYNQGYRTLEDLWEKEKLTPAIRTAIIYSEHLKLRIPRYEMNLIKQALRDIFSHYNPTLIWIIAGSFRRGEQTSGDIDVLIQEEPDISLFNLVEELRKTGIIVGELALGQRKFLGIIQLPGFNAHRIDLLMIPKNNWAYSLMYFTGSQQFNILLRNRAQDLGYRLNEYGLYPADESGQAIPNEPSLPATTEEDIFKYLGVKYMTPEERTRNIQSLPLV